MALYRHTANRPPGDEGKPAEEPDAQADPTPDPDATAEPTGVVDSVDIAASSDNPRVGDAAADRGASQDTMEQVSSDSTRAVVDLTDNADQPAEAQASPDVMPDADSVMAPAVEPFSTSTPEPDGSRSADVVPLSEVLLATHLEIVGHADAMKQVSDSAPITSTEPSTLAVTSADAKQPRDEGQPADPNHPVDKPQAPVADQSSDPDLAADSQKSADGDSRDAATQSADDDSCDAATQSAAPDHSDTGATPADAGQPAAVVPDTITKPPVKRPAILRRIEAARRAEAMKRAAAAKAAEIAQEAGAAKAPEVAYLASSDQQPDVVESAAVEQPAEGTGPDFIAPHGSTAQVPDIVVPRNHLVTGLGDSSTEDRTADDSTAKPPTSAVTDSEGASPVTPPSVTATLVSPVVAGPDVVPPPPDRKRTKAGILVTLVSIVVVLVTLTGIGGVGVAFFGSHAKPGAQLAGFDITGFSQAQVRDVAQTLINNYKATLELDGHQAVATAKDLGVTFDLDKTVSSAMGAGSTHEVAAQYSPFTTKNVPLVMSVDHKKLQDLLDNTFVAQDQKSVPASVTYDADQQKFVAVPGRAGLQADEPQVAQELAYGQGIESPLQVATKQEPPQVADTAAQTAADTANQRLAAPYVLTAGSKTYTIPASTIAGWTVFTPDPATGALKVGVDSEQVTADLPDLLSENLTTAMTPQQTLLRPDGEVLGTQQNGAAGTSLADPDGVFSAVSDALTAGTGLTLSVDTVTQPPTSENVPMDDKYLVPNGEQWVEVNLTNFTVTRWEGTTAVSTWSVVIGLPGTPTHPGIFHVWLKVALQDMSGPGYLAKNVPWIAYFDGDIAIHGNYWVSSFGHAASHGCVGLPPDLAKTMYDWIDTGTLVVVHN